MNRGFLLGIILLSGCATAPKLNQEAAQTTTASVTPTPEAAAGDVESVAEPGPIERLTLDVALELAEKHHPALDEFRAQIDAAEGRALQAGLFPNPELIARIESAPFSGGSFSDAEEIAGIGQSIPWGGRLAAARRAETLEKERRSVELKAKRMEVRIRVQKAFAAALYWEQLVRAWQGGRQIAQNGADAARARFEAGDAIQADVGQAENELRRAELELNRAHSRLAQSRHELLTAIGSPNLQYGKIEAASDAISLKVPEVDLLLDRLGQSPYLQLTEAEVAVRTANVALVKAESKPDVELELAYRRLGNEYNGADIGLRLPLSIFDRNQGAIREAEAELASAEARAKATHHELELAVRRSTGDLARAIDSVNLLQGAILPQARETLKVAEARYAEGDISLIEILPLRRDAISLQLEYQSALLEVMHAWADLSPYLQ